MALNFRNQLGMHLACNGSTAAVQFNAKCRTPKIEICTHSQEYEKHTSFMSIVYYM